VLLNLDPLIYKLVMQLQHMRTDMLTSELADLQRYELARTAPFLDEVYAANANVLLGDGQGFRFESRRDGTLGVWVLDPRKQEDEEGSKEGNDLEAESGSCPFSVNQVATYGNNFEDVKPNEKAYASGKFQSVTEAANRKCCQKENVCGIGCKLQVLQIMVQMHQTESMKLSPLRRYNMLFHHLMFVLSGVMLMD
jgi:hypothetical protein